MIFTGSTTRSRSFGRDEYARAAAWLQGNWYRTGTSRSDVRHREYADTVHAGQVVCIVRRRWSGGMRPWRAVARYCGPGLRLSNRSLRATYTVLLSFLNRKTSCRDNKLIYVYMYNYLHMIRSRFRQGYDTE